MPMARKYWRGRTIPPTDPEKTAYRLVLPRIPLESFLPRLFVLPFRSGVFVFGGVAVRDLFPVEGGMRPRMSEASRVRVSRVVPNWVGLKGRRTEL